MAPRPRPCCASTPGSNQLKSNSGDRTWYFMLNLTQPPFDDIHIRKAINWVVNKEALRKAWGGPFAGNVATHIAPDNMLADKLKGYAPYGSGKGDVAKAKAEVKLSKYDSNHDGICDAKRMQEHLLDQWRSLGGEDACCRRSSRTSSPSA